MKNKKWTKEEVKRYVEGSTEIDFAKTFTGATKDVDAALKEMNLSDFIEKAFTVFTDQVTCVCTETGEELFDIERAKIIRSQLADVFKATLEVIDEEIEEYS